MFENIIGNNENKKILSKSILTNSVSHSYIFSGISGIGKFLFAKEFAKAILCTGEPKPCNICKSCESIENGNNPDLVIIDEQSNSIKTEQIKELTSDVLEKPIKGSKKIYIINNSENMTKEAQNALLKTLEEPPEYAVIILVTSNENLLLNTIKSRCIKILFSNLSDEEILEYFERNHEDISKTMVSTFGGSIERAINLKDKIEIYEKIKNVFENIEQLNELEVLRLKDDLLNDKDEIFSILDYINTCFYNKMINNISKAEKYNNCIQAVEEAKTRLRRNNNYDMTIDNLLFAIERSITNG